MIEIPLKGVLIGVKRLYLPILLKSTCPCCTEEVEYNLSDQELSYPIVGEEETLEFYCQECDREFTRKLVLNMSITFEDEGEIIE